ncbi:hypothetical protein AHV57_23785 [Salmonella enterica]|nr:hypothetical protein [Salmonella enterica]
MGNNSETKDGNKKLHISASNLSLEELGHQLADAAELAKSLQPHYLYGDDTDFDGFMRNARKHAEKLGSMIDFLSGESIDLSDEVLSGFDGDLKRLREIRAYLGGFLSAMERLGEPAGGWWRSWFSNSRKAELLKSPTKYSEDNPEQ